MEETAEETEEILVLAELTGIIDNDFLLEEHHTAKILGIDTENPILQIDNYIFSGEYQTIKGTAVIFEEKETDGDEIELNYYCKTFKKLAMKRVFLQERNHKSETSSERLNDTTMDDESSANLHMLGDEIIKHKSTLPSTAMEEDKDRNVCDTNNDQSIADKNLSDVCMEVLSTFPQSSVEEGRNTNVADGFRGERIVDQHALDGKNAEDPSSSSELLIEKLEEEDHCPYIKNAKGISTIENKNIEEEKSEANFTVHVVQ